MDEISDLRPDGPMTPEQEAVVAALEPEVLEKIDDFLLSSARRTYRKVARLVGMAIFESSFHLEGLPDVFYANRIKGLVAAGKLEAFGNLDYMRYSEVRLPK